MSIILCKKEFVAQNSGFVTCAPKMPSVITPKPQTSNRKPSYGIMGPYEFMVFTSHSNFNMCSERLLERPMPFARGKPYVLHVAQHCADRCYPLWYLPWFWHVQPLGRLFKTNLCQSNSAARYPDSILSQHALQHQRRTHRRDLYSCSCLVQHQNSQSH